MHNDTVETLIGAAVIAVAVFFLAFAYRSTGSTGISGYELTANLSRVDGIAVGTDVRLSGIKVGAVSSLTLNPNYLVTVHMNIHNDVQIPADSSLVVTSAGLLGSSYLSISPGGSDKMLPPGGAIRNTQGSLDMMGLLSRFVGGGTSGGNNNSGGNSTAPKP
ncbi:MAG: outer membrane lipid asymmetry maintenance protein MlaD [Alphaproteobacteria bacterium]|nr:outer membrane lipid asymmetry maintenance protein MlaD [Alphaproteobacteria bacterium]MDE2110826.1 outer membrane lipid asymmetry maintenance protein MlaD [Alphaproteobacteria bacterium]MDE2495500.1 outer membrane lipid asymmetry maintenance protein MlaD [Alphaproteobacteria bacterium]